MTRAGFGYRRIAVFTATVLLVLSVQAHAIPPIILHTFEFTDESRLGVTGGFAGIDELHGIDGTFGLAIGYEQVYDAPSNISLVPFASFVDIDAVLTRPGLLEGADLDSLLNLTGLEGTFVFGHDHRGLLFTGVDGQGQPMVVKVGVQNKQLHLSGANDAGCCDMFNYRLDAYAKIPHFGDIDKDGYVGITDLNTVLGSWGNDVTPMMSPDANWDGYVGIADLNAVLGEWGEGVSAGIPVPEPVTTAMLACGVLCGLLRRRYGRCLNHRPAA